MQPLLKYPGGKMNEFHLVNRFKPKAISRYFEPFLGGAAIYLNINILKSYINDKSEDLIKFYQYIKLQEPDFFTYLKELDRLWKTIEDNSPPTSSLFDTKKYLQYFKQSLSLKEKKLNSLETVGLNISLQDKIDAILTAKKTALYMCIRDIYNHNRENPYLHTACFYFIREYCYSSMFRFSKNGIFNVPYGGRSYNSKYITQKIEAMQSKEVFEYLKDTSIYNLDFEEFLNLFTLNPSDFIFLDPPYDSEFSTYDNNQFDQKEQKRLALFLKKTPAKWMLIIKKTDFIYELYKQFHIYEYDKQYLVSFKNRNTKETKHLLITNYPLNI